MASIMNPKSSFRWGDFEALRRIPLATMGVFMSSYCPVECAHCAVSASSRLVERSPEPMIRGVEEMVQVPGLEAVAVTGGEPFAEVELLKTLTTLVHNAGKRVVIYTSGYWGRADTLESVAPVLHSVDGLILGMDLYHRAHIPDGDLINAMRIARDYGAWVAPQVIYCVDGDAHLAYARSILEEAYGARWETHATIVKNPPVPSGRAENIKSFNHFGSPLGGYCYSINGPTLLRDGTLAACCNEDIVLHRGPRQLRVEYRGSFHQSLEELERRPILGYLRKLPPTVLASLASRCLKSEDSVQPARLCQACWAFADRYACMDDSQKERFAEMVDIYLEIQGSPQEHSRGELLFDVAEPEQVSHV